MPDIIQKYLNIWFLKNSNVYIIITNSLCFVKCDETTFLENVSLMMFDSQLNTCGLKVDYHIYKSIFLIYVKKIGIVYTYSWSMHYVCI